MVAGLRQHVARAGHFLDAGRNAHGQFAQGVQVGAEELDGHVATAAGEHFGDAHLDGLGEAEVQAGEGRHHLADFFAQRFLVHAPCLAVAELHEHIGFVQAHGIKPQFVRADAGDAVLHFGHFGQDGFLHGQVDVARAVQPDGGRLLQLQQDVALVHRRHEGLAGAQVGHHAQHQGRQRHGCGPQRVGQRGIQHRAVQAQRAAHHPGLAVRMRLEQ